MKPLFLMLLLLVLCNCKGQAPEHDASDNWSTYYDRASGLKLIYPKHWDTSDQDDRVLFMAAEINKDTLDRFNENLNVTTFPIEGMSLSDILDLNENAAKSHYGNNAVIHRSTYVNDHGIEIGEFKLEQAIQDLDLVHRSHFFIHEGRSFCLTFGNESNKSVIYDPVRNKVINSVQFE